MRQIFRNHCYPAQILVSDWLSFRIQFKCLEKLFFQFFKTFSKICSRLDYWLNLKIRMRSSLASSLQVRTVLRRHLRSRQDRQSAHVHAPCVDVCVTIVNQAVSLNSANNQDESRLSKKGTRLKEKLFKTFKLGSKRNQSDASI